MDRPLIAIIGPTGSGKSSLSIFLARAVDGEILSCDAFQVYRGLDVGTAKVMPPEQQGIPHYLIDLVNPGETFSAGDYMRRGREALEYIRQRGRVPIVVGGTGLYLRALLQGLFDSPPRAETLRRRLNRIADHKGVPFLHRRLMRVDRAAADRITPNDRTRLIRALEVYHLTGKSISEHFRTPTDALTGYRLLKIGLNPPRPALYERINLRVVQMFENGLIEEVERLRAQGVAPDARAFAAIGYSQALAYRQGRISREQAIERTQRDSRRYAKRQMTWFRKEKDVSWIVGFGHAPETQAQALSWTQALLSESP